MVLIPVKSQPDGSNVFINYTQELMSHTPKTFQSIHIYLFLIKKPTEGFFSYLFFVSEIILIFGGKFLT